MNRDELLAILDEWGAEKPKAVGIKGKTFYVRGVTVAEVDARNADRPQWQRDQSIAVGTAAIICDENGKMLLDPDNADDVKRVGKQMWGRIRKIVNAWDDDLAEGSPSGN